MDISKFTKAIAAYIKPEEVIKNPNIPFIITTEGTIVEKDYKGKPNTKVHIEGEWKAEIRTFDMSKTNARKVEQALGTDTKKWIGHQLFLETYKMSSSENPGKLIDAINIKEVK